MPECEFKYHDEDLRDEFKDLPAHKQAPIEARTLRYLDSLLADLERKLVRSRQRIENPAEEAAELAAVRADKDARVLRVKNRLDPDHDAAGSAGAARAS